MVQSAQAWQCFMDGSDVMKLDQRPHEKGQLISNKQHQQSLAVGRDHGPVQLTANRSQLISDKQHQPSLAVGLDHGPVQLTANRSQLISN